LEDDEASILEGVATVATTTEDRPSISASNTKMASNKTSCIDAQKKKRTTSIAELPPFLTTFTYADGNRLVSGDKLDGKKKDPEKQGPFLVTTRIRTT
jgi:hypothetical protein